MLPRNIQRVVLLGLVGFWTFLEGIRISSVYLAKGGLRSVEGNNKSSGTRWTSSAILNQVSPSQITCAHSQIM